MMEMSVDRETVKGETNLPSIPRSPEKTTDAHLDKDCTETGNEVSDKLKEEDESGLLDFDSQNGTQQSRTQLQKLNKRRSTMSGGFKCPGYGKRRRRANSETSSVLPTNFLLGGNIFDPLNLNSLLDDEVNRALNAETPKSSPLPAKNRDPVEILIPRDITDPLNLKCPTAGKRSFMVSPLKSSGGGRRRHRNKHHGVVRGLGEATVAQNDPTEPNGCPAAVQVDGTASVSESCLESDAHDPEVLKEDQTPTLESNTNVGDEKDTCTASANSSSKRPRRRKRAGSRTEISDGSYGPSLQSKRYSGHPVGTGAGRPRPQPHPNQVRSQYNDKQKTKFQYGNYNKYYGYRNPGLSEDPRIRVFKPEWFQGKDVLDLGCNTGHLTLSIAKNWRPARIVGLDIDGELIRAARQNIRHYLSEVHVRHARRPGENGERDAEDEKKREDSTEEKSQKMEKNEGADGESKEKEERWMKKENDAENKSTGDSGNMEDEACGDLSDGKTSFPVSLRISRGPIAGPPLPDMSTNNLPPGDFPANINFIKGNYVLQSDLLLQTQKEEYDVILCLSVTKWVHLNWGDAGLKRLFHRVYRHLRPGGLFILEPQPWNSYGRRKKLTEVICKNYHSIRFRPDQFSSFLTTDVGFSSYELIGTSQSLSKGFQRPIYIFYKGRSP